MSPHGFIDRVEAATKAGFCGIGLWRGDLEHIIASVAYWYQSLPTAPFSMLMNKDELENI